MLRIASIYFIENLSIDVLESENWVATLNCMVKSTQTDGIQNRNRTEIY